MRSTVLIWLTSYLGLTLLVTLKYIYMLLFLLSIIKPRQCWKGTLQIETLRSREKQDWSKVCNSLDKFTFLA